MNKQNNIEVSNLKNLTPEAFSAFQFYEGDTNNNFLPSSLFDESTRKASKAYITINTVMQNNSTEEKIFKEGKKMLPELITPGGVEKLLELYKTIYSSSYEISTENVQKMYAFKRCSEMTEQCIKSLTSVTKLSPKEIYKQGYGNKVDLALCCYSLHKGALIFDFEKLGDLYKKKQEREVLLMIGNKTKVQSLGEDKNFLGIDGKPAKIFNIDVFGPNFDGLIKTNTINESIQLNENMKSFHKDIKPKSYDSIFDENRLKIVRDLYYDINTNIGGIFPKIPQEYWEWKYDFQQIVYRMLKSIVTIHNS